MKLVRISCAQSYPLCMTLAGSSHNVLCCSMVKHDVWKVPDTAICSLFPSFQTLLDSVVSSMKNAW